VVQKGLELDLGIAQHIGVGRAAGLVFAQKLGKHAVLVVGREVDVLDLDADHIGHGGGVHEVDVGRAVLAVVIVFPVLHEDADHLVALLFEQVGGDGGVHAAREADDNALFGRAVIAPIVFLELPALDLIEMAPPAVFRRSLLGVPVGTWSDDSAQALHLLKALLEGDAALEARFADGLQSWYWSGELTISRSCAPLCGCVSWPPRTRTWPSAWPNWS
jgi:hypothetical protein